MIDIDNSEIDLHCLKFVHKYPMDPDERFDMQEFLEKVDEADLEVFFSRLYQLVQEEY